MGKRIVTYKPIPSNWPQPGWSLVGPATFIPTADDNSNTGMKYAPGAGGGQALTFNFKNAAMAPPALLAGESFSRMRVVFVANTGNDWLVAVNNGSTQMMWFNKDNRVTPLYWGVWGSNWINISGFTNNMANFKNAINFTVGSFNTKANFTVMEMFVEVELNTPDPPPKVPPTAGFDATATFLDVAVDGTLSTCEAGATISTYSWNWGDGSPATTGAKTGHTYLNDGAYRITLTVTDSRGLTATASRSVNVVGQVPPGGGGTPEIADPDPTPPPAVAPPTPPELDTAVRWYPAAQAWATEFNGWNVVSHEGTTSDAATLPLTILDSDRSTGIAAKADGGTLTMHFPLADANNNAAYYTNRYALPSGEEFKRIKLRAYVQSTGSDPSKVGWKLELRNGATPLGSLTQVYGDSWSSAWISLDPDLNTDALVDGLRLVLSGAPAGVLFRELWVEVEYGKTGTTLPPLPTETADHLSALPGSIRLTVTPGAAGVPGLTDPLDPTHSDIKTVIPSNGIALPFGYGIGGYGLNVGSIDGNGVEWWLTGVKGWDDGFNAELSVVDPRLGTGTFVNNVRGQGREVTVTGVLYSTDKAALADAKRRLAGCLSEPPHVGWMQMSGTLLPVALAEPITIEHVSPTRVDFEAVFRGVRAPYSLGMGVWREGRIHQSVLPSDGYVDFEQGGSTPMTPIVEVMGPLDRYARIDAYSLGGTYRSGGMVLQEPLAAGVKITINNILRTVRFSNDAPATGMINWASSRWMYLDPRGCRVITTGSGSGSWTITARELW